MSMVIYAEGCNTILERAKAKVRNAAKVLSDAQWALIDQNIKIEKQCKEWGIEPITLQANMPWPTDRLYVLTEEGKQFISRYDYEDPGTAYDMLFCIAQKPSMFIVIELTKEYVEYLETLELLEQLTEEDLRDE